MSKKTTTNSVKNSLPGNKKVATAAERFAAYQEVIRSVTSFTTFNLEYLRAVIDAELYDRDDSDINLDLANADLNDE